MAFVLIEHRVGDFRTFTRVFRGDEARRESLGCKGGVVYRVADDPVNVIVVLEWETREAAREGGARHVVTGSAAADFTAVSGSLTFPANFMLLCAMNPCPCGNYNEPDRECTCSLTQVLRYQKRISGPLLDRIDIHIQVPRVDYEKLSGDRLAEPSAKIRERVERAREHQRKRLAGTNLQCNGDMGPAEVRQFCAIDDASKNLLRAAMQQMQLSARAYHRILKLSRTIADLAGSDKIETPHLAEAIQYRPRKQLGEI